MRKGVNPEKNKADINQRYFHRVIIPVYIPKSKSEFYSNSINVFKVALTSLLNSINPDTTAITIIDNNSKEEVEFILKDNIDKIDKIVSYNQNKGKVYSIINEARATYEPFVTIADADVLFVGGWENTVFNIFENFPRCGVVAPLPCSGLAFNHNTSLFFDKYITGKIKYGSIVKEEDSKLYIEGLGNSAILDRNNRNFHWYQKQYYLGKEIKAVVGAGHFVATYRSAIFKGETSFPKIKFKNGYEDQFIDILADKKGYYRLSTTETFAYHIGNHLDENVERLKSRKGTKLSMDLIKNIDLNFKNRFSYFKMRRFFFKAIKKFFKL